MAHIFHQDELPRLLSVVPGRERAFFVSKELTDMDDMLADVMYYDAGAASPCHMHKHCEQFGSSCFTSSSRFEKSSS